MTNAPLNENTFRQIRDLIYERSGIFIPDSKKYLIENRLLKRVQVRNLTSFDEYARVITNGTCNEELPHLFDAVTTNETYFFREAQQFDVFLDHIVPRVFESKKAKEIRIWSAACSTGEEPYTILMMARERMAGSRLECIASDISNGVLDSARKGVYSSYSVRNVPEAYLRKYFRLNGQTYELDPSVRQAVSFRNVNLFEEKTVRTIRGVDAVFCRNVLIYFDDRSKQKVVSSLYDSLRPGGHLIIGSSESLHNVTRAFKPVIINKVVVYQKV